MLGRFQGRPSTVLYGIKLTLACNRLAIGIGMIPRGEVGLVFAGIGTASGVLDKPLQAAIIIMVILTTFVAPPLLRFAFQEETQLVEQPVSVDS